MVGRGYKTGWYVARGTWYVEEPRRRSEVGRRKAIQRSGRTTYHVPQRVQRTRQNAPRSSPCDHISLVVPPDTAVSLHDPPGGGEIDAGAGGFG